MIERIDLIHKPEAIGSIVDHIPNAQILKQSTLSAQKIASIKENLTTHFENVATDLKYDQLAQGHVERLIDHLVQSSASTEYDLVIGGAKAFYEVSEQILGPLWAAHVDEVYKSGHGNEIYLFPARDATPMYWASEGLLSKPNGYKLDNSGIVHVDWNRWFMGQEDETDSNRKALPLSHPDMKQFYEQMGFGNGKLVKIIEPGAWGSAANALKTKLPNQPFELWFMFSHMPDRIYGFLNEHAPHVDPKVFEMINDTAEAVPKAYTRPETFINENEIIKPDVSNQVIPSVYIQIWSKSVLMGAYSAGINFSLGNRVDIKKHISEIANLSKQSQQGIWTGVLPHNTPTWSDGEKWVNNWQWGKIPPKK